MHKPIATNCKNVSLLVTNTLAYHTKKYNTVVKCLPDSDKHTSLFHLVI
jgi:hypothetical protein